MVSNQQTLCNKSVPEIYHSSSLPYPFSLYNYFMNKILVITGERGSGKSRYCAHLLEKAKFNGLKTGGFLSPAICENGIKTGFYTLDAASGEQRFCGKRVSEGGTIGCWQIDSETIKWGNELLTNSCPCDILFVDELGPLEFDKHEGYTQAFETLKSGSYKTAYVVIRPACLDAFRILFPEFELITIKEGNVPLD